LQVAYLIQSHKGVRQLRRLVQRLSMLDPSAIVHVSHDRNGEAGVQELQRLPGVAVQLADGGRGRYHNVQRWVDAARWVADRGGADYVVLLSGQDYPVRSLEQMKRELAATPDGFLEAFPVLDPSSSWPVREGRTRYLYRWHDVRPIRPSTKRRLRGLQGVNRVQPLIRVNVAYDTLRFGVRRRRGAIDDRIYGGSMFTSLSWRAVEHVLATVDARPDLVRWARESLVIEEAFFQTILMNEPLFTFQPSSRRFYRFGSGGPGSPAVLTTADVPTAVASGSFFARKFDMALDAAALDAADEAVDRQADGRLAT
jgi:hypothetical protein